MATEYDLAIESDIGPRRLLGTAFPDLLSSIYDDRGPSGGLLVRLDTEVVGCVARHETDHRVREVYAEIYGINPRVSLSFRLDKFRPDDAAQQMADAVVRVLRAVPGDAILVLNGETPIARRRGDQGVLAERSWFWTPAVLEQLGPGWRIGPDPGPTNL
jgi:hypothetical protein